jgi:hypothetical protein
MPEENLPEDGTLFVGNIDFRVLTPGNNTFRFEMGDFKEMQVFDNVVTVTAKVDLSGYAETTLNLPRDAIKVTPEESAPPLAPRNGVNQVRVVGPAAVVAALTDDSLTATATVPTNAENANTLLAADIRVDNNSCWVVGTYEVACGPVS